MYGLKKILLREYKRLEKIAEKCKKELKELPEGTLRVSKSHNSYQFYYCADSKGTGKYIGKDKEVLIKQLAQKAYDQRVLRKVEKQIKQLQSFMSGYEDDAIEKIYYKEHPAKLLRITPVEPTWEQRLQAWKEKPYIGKEFPEDLPVIMTDRGERVRSKSEKIMADYFYRHGIEYKYECPLHLKGVGIVYPDFTFLSPKTYKEIYWEHNGRMDDPVYSKKAVRKICSYENNGIYPGENLILTFETEQMILNTAQIEQMVQKYLIL